MLRTLSVALLFSFATLSQAQKAPTKFGEISLDEMKMTSYEKDSAAAAVILFDKGESYLDEQLTVTFTRHTRIKFFSKEAFDTWASETIYLSRSEESISKLKGSTYNLENGKIVESKLEDQGIFKSRFDRYVDQIKFTMPNVKEGSVIEYSYTKRTSASLLPGWQFQYAIPNLWSEYRTSTSKYFTFKKDMQGYLEITTHESKNEGSVERWVMADVPAFKEEPFITTSDDYVSKISFYLTEVFVPGQAVMDFSTTWNKISKELLEDSDFGVAIRSSGYLNKYVEEITAGILDPLKKAEAIYGFVKKNVEWNETIDKIPDHTFKKVLEEKKGSSSEINLLLVSMLQKADIKADPVLISTRAHGRIRFNPSFSQFNDVICLVTIGEKKIFLDGTDKYLPMNALPKRCLNGSGFIVTKDNPDWIAITTSKARTVINTDFKISDSGELSGQLNISRDGHDGGSMRKSYFDLGEEKYVTEAFGDKSWEIEKSKFDNVTSTDQSAKELHDLIIRDHAQTAGDIIYVNPYVLGRIEENPFKNQNREYPVDFSAPFDKFYMAKIQIPENFIVEELPKPKIMAMPNNAGKFIYSTTLVGNTINFVSQVSINKNSFLIDEYPILREFYNQMIAKQAEQIVVKKK